MGKIDYSVFAIPKDGITPKMRRATKRRKAIGEEGRVKRLIVARDGPWCFFRAVCRTLGVDRHEIVPKGAGGEVTTANCVLVCRSCHDKVQGEVGGRKLWIHWRGEDEGLPPNADRRGHVWPVWAGKDAA